MSKWKCRICGYVYDEAKEGVPFADLPDSWVCPLCGADRASFAPEEAPAPKPAAVTAAIPEDRRQLSAGEWAAVCSNLARGCEKQYQEPEAALFRELADYFTAAAAEIPGGTLEQLLEGLQRDLEEGYPALRAGAQAAGDRGTQRICVWGEKVTAMLQSLLQRYQREGEAFLENTSVWVCSVCGFIYVGDRPPELCPVCKVPPWKFEKAEGRG